MSQFDNVFCCQDETAVCGNNNEHQKILAGKGHKEILYKHSNGSRLHVTLCITVQAIGSTSGVRVVHDGQVFDGRRKNSFHLNLLWLFQRVICGHGKKHLSTLPRGPNTGEWKFSVSPSGFCTRRITLQLVVDLDEYCTKHEVIRPVILFVDGFSGHKG